MASRMTAAEVSKLDRLGTGLDCHCSRSFIMHRMESECKKLHVVLTAYDGRELHGFVYVIDKPWGTGEYTPSRRYLRVLTTGVLVGINQKCTTTLPIMALLRLCWVRVPIAC